MLPKKEKTPKMTYPDENQGVSGTTPETKTRKKPKRREAEFCTDLAKELKKHSWAFKIPDSPGASWHTNSPVRFTPKKAIDIVCANMTGQLCAVEAKMWKLKREPDIATVWKLLRPDQAAELTRVREAKGNAFIVLKRYIPRHSEYFLLTLAGDYIETFSSIKELVKEILKN